MLGTLRTFLQKKPAVTAAKPAAEAYDLWADSYDAQPGNLMLDLDEEIFPALLRDIALGNKTIADIGCGTGRHWAKLYAGLPASLTGYDVSDGMLKQLKLKFPEAVTFHVTDNLLADTAPHTYDCIISTLTIAHIKDLEETITAWCRVLKPGGDLIITDFHPAALAKGGRRTFRHGAEKLSVINYVHPLDKIIQVCKSQGLSLIKKEERFVDETVKHYYLDQNAIPVFNRFKGIPIIYGLHLKKLYGSE